MNSRIPIPDIPSITILNYLDSGTFGDVFRGIMFTPEFPNGLEVAVKTLKLWDADSRKRFKREAELLHGVIDNRYVVNCYDYNLDHSPPYMVLQYCTHGNMREWVRIKRPWQDVTTAMAQVVHGLHGIHQAGGFHRDLKPENLLVTKAPNGKLSIKVADFGLARVPGSQTNMTFRAGGTTPYMAPELKGGADFSAAADIYSFGVLFGELLTGSRDPSALQQAQLPRGLVALVRAMTSADPEKRPTTRTVAKELNALLNPGSSHPPDPPKPPPSNSGGAGLLWLLGGAAVLGLGLLAGGNDASWDSNVGRKRDSKGRFTT